MFRQSLAALLILATPALADSPVVNNVKATKSGDLWNFDVTLSHGDTGWDDYADAWRIVDVNGKELAVRKLAHPHVNEQPFTRSLSGIKIPEGVFEIGVQASDSVGGWSAATKKVILR